jgi:hypothetical protein
VAAVATDEPQIAAKPPQAAMVAMPSPPRRWPTKELAALAAHARGGGERSHQQEQRDDREAVVGDGPHRSVADIFQRRRPAHDVGEAAHADQAHGHADRHAQQHQHEQGDETQDRNRVGTHRKDLTRPA